MPKKIASTKTDLHLAMNNEIEIHFAYAELITVLKFGLRKIADEKGALKMIEEASDSGELLEKLLKKNMPPHITIIGIAEGENLFKTLQHIEFMKIKWPAMGILIFTGSLHEYFINQFIRLGVNGILNKRNDSDEDLLEAMNNIRVSGFHYGSLATEDQFEAIHQKKIDVSPLTEREIGLIRDRCAGKTYKETAIALKEEYMIVYRACKKLSRKLNLKERFGLTIFGLHAGIDFDVPKGLKSSLERVF